MSHIVTETLRKFVILAGIWLIKGRFYHFRKSKGAITNEGIQNFGACKTPAKKI